MGSIARVQSNQGVVGTLSTPLTATLTNPVTPGNVVVALVAGANGAISAADHFSLVTTDDAQGDIALFAYLATDTVHSWNFTCSGNAQWSWRIEEWSGISGTAQNVAHNSTTAATSLSCSPGTTVGFAGLAIVGITTAKAGAGATLGTMSFNQGIATDITNQTSGGASGASCDLCTGTVVISAPQNFTSTTCTYTSSVLSDIVFAFFPEKGALPFRPGTSIRRPLLRR